METISYIIKSAVEREFRRDLAKLGLVFIDICASERQAKKKAKSEGKGAKYMFHNSILHGSFHCIVAPEQKPENE